ncbi:hypothetical protein [Paenibacillus sophorae]|uniref:hypothetical protein n=1 Tax=Paenibacillus sophorae TaxID=1333845 RepID=UPI00349EE152
MTTLLIILNEPSRFCAWCLAAFSRSLLRLTCTVWRNGKSSAIACMLARPLRPIDVETHLSINHRTAVRMLQALCGKGWFTAMTGAMGKHVVRYELQRGAMNQIMQKT